jgi:hypothetical protein
VCAAVAFRDQFRVSSAPSHSPLALIGSHHDAPKNNWQARRAAAADNSPQNPAHYTLV